MRTLFIFLAFGLIAFSCSGQNEAAAAQHSQSAPRDTTPVALAKSYEASAAATFASGDYEKSMEFFSKAFPYLQKDPALIDSPGVLLTHAVRILIQQQLPSEALGILRAIDIPAVAAKHDNLDPEQIILGKGDCFYAMNEPDSAQRYYREALRYVPNPGFSKYKVVAYETLANFYTGTRQYAKAKPLLDTLTAAANRATTPLTTRANAYFQKYQADSAIQNHSAALTHLRQYHLLQDTLAAIGKSRQFAEMDSLFETEKKTQHATDQAAQAALQTQLAQSAKNRNYLFIAAVLLLLALAAAGYSRYQFRRRLAASLDTLEQNKQNHLDEKEQLRREIHQRAMNQLATTITLLGTQATRPVPLSLAYKMLSNTAGSTTIDTPDYLRALIACIRKGLTIHRPIVWRLDLADSKLDVTQCVPLGCIINEAITNAIKHAFNDGSTPSPTIHISLREEPKGSIMLLIADNGTGLPAGFDTGFNPDLPAGLDPANPTVPGLQLIQTLTRELEGTLEMTSAAAGTSGAAASTPAPAATTRDATPRGLTITIRFPLISPK